MIDRWEFPILTQSVVEVNILELVRLLELADKGKKYDTLQSDYDQSISEAIKLNIQITELRKQIPNSDYDQPNLSGVFKLLLSNESLEIKEAIQEYVLANPNRVFKLAAIKKYRDLTNLELKEAKEIIERIIEEYSLVTS